MPEQGVQLFVAIVTGQNVANFPPILECARPGDKVLWLESVHASKLNWFEPAKNLLESYGLETLPPVRLPEEKSISAWPEKLHDQVALARRNGWHPVLVLNGGNKLMALALLEAWRDQRPTLIYGYDRPVALWRSEAALTGPCSLSPYTRHRLDLQDILTLNGYQLHAPPRQIIPISNEVLGSPEPEIAAWRDPIGEVAEEKEASAVVGRWLPLSACLNQREAQQISRAEFPDSWERNVQNFFATAKKRSSDQPFCNLYHAAVNVLKEQALCTNWDFASFGEVSQFVHAADFERWKQQLCDMFFPNDRLTKEKVSDVELLQQVFWHVCAMIYVHVSARKKPGSSGEDFENAVAARVAKFVLDSEAKHVVQSIQVGIKVSPIADPCTVAAELDVVLVIKNAVLIHIECKLGIWDRNDLDARLTNLKRIGSNIALLVICAPLYTRATWDNLIRQHETRVAIESMRDLYYLPFTEPGQPAEYQIVDSDGEERTYNVQSFEERLQKLLEPFLLKTA